MTNYFNKGLYAQWLLSPEKQLSPFPQIPILNSALFDSGSVEIPGLREIHSPVTTEVVTGVQGYFELITEKVRLRSKDCVSV